MLAGQPGGGNVISSDHVKYPVYVDYPREVIITGIGGQGVQLMAKVLAQAANRAGQQVMLFGIMMRGGSSEQQRRLRTRCG